MAEEILPILERHASCAPSPTEPVLQIMHPYVSSALDIADGGRALLAALTGGERKQLGDWLVLERNRLTADEHAATSRLAVSNLNQLAEAIRVAGGSQQQAADILAALSDVSKTLRRQQRAVQRINTRPDRDTSSNSLASGDGHAMTIAEVD